MSELHEGATKQVKAFLAGDEILEIAGMAAIDAPRALRKAYEAGLRDAQAMREQRRAMAIRVMQAHDYWMPICNACACSPDAHRIGIKCGEFEPHEFEVMPEQYAP